MTVSARTAGPRWLYLHGFGSGPASFKGRMVADHFSERGISVERLNLRIPSLEHLRLSAMIDHLVAEIGEPQDRAVVFGSSLGGLTASYGAQRDSRICALVLLAPAFGLAARWVERLGPMAAARWKETGWLEIDDYAEQCKARVDYAFFEDMQRVESAMGAEPDVRVPTLIIHGRGDDVVPIENSRRWAAGRRHVRLVEVDDGHELSGSGELILREAERHLSGCIGGDR